MSAQHKGLYRQVVASTATPGLTALGAALKPTAITVAPDGRVFFSIVDGRIFALTLNSNLLATSAQLYDVIYQYGFTTLGQGGRLVTGMAFGPNNDLFVSHSDGRIDCLQPSGPPANCSSYQQGSGKVSRLFASTNYSTYQDVVTGLPRNKHNHGPNGLAFQGGFLYLAQGGMTNAGLPGTDVWTEPETPDSGAILRINPNTTNDYIVFATGFRNPYKPLFHSNGSFYVNDNGLNDATPPTTLGPKPIGGGSCAPSPIPPTVNPDELNLVVQGDYYGHPNPFRVGQCDLNLPLAHHAPLLLPSSVEPYGLNASANGLTEYTSNAMPQLPGHIFSALFSKGTVSSFILNGTSLWGRGPAHDGFTLPVDVHATAGNIFVAEYSGVVSGVISVLRPLYSTQLDFDADRMSDLTVFRPSTNTWHTLRTATPTSPLTYTSPSGDTPLPIDYDGDTKVDHVSWNPSTGLWTVRKSLTGPIETFTHGGSPGDQALCADIDGDGRGDQVIFRAPGWWFVRYANTGTVIAYQWGAYGDVPRVMDYNGDGRTDLTVFRPSNNTWYILPYGSAASPYNPAGGFSVMWGVANDIPVPADYDGDGRTDIAIFRPSTGQWYIVLASTGYNTATGFLVQWGLPNDEPRPLDWDGDGKSDVVLFRPSTGQWFAVTAASGFNTATGISGTWGQPGDTAVAQWP